MVLALSAALAGAFAGLKLEEVLRGRLAGPAFHKTLFLVFVALGATNLARGV